MPLSDQQISCPCGFRAHQVDGVLDLLPSVLREASTADHYTKQWGAELGFAKFLKANPEAASAMPSTLLGWHDLFMQIRQHAMEADTLVYDAACGFGGVFTTLFEAPVPGKLCYLGADIHRSLSSIARISIGLDVARFIRWDISEPLPITERFDYVICRAAIHHTPDPPRTFRSLVSVLRPGGTIAISAYAKKSPMREAVDDALRSRVARMSVTEAFELARQFTRLGEDLQHSAGRIVIQEDLPFLGIDSGEYAIHEFIYNHFMKCWFNPIYGDQYSDLVNFDWYHPPYAFASTSTKSSDGSGPQVSK